MRTNRGYVSDPAIARDYGAYQDRYIASPRESDKKIGRLVKQAMRGRAGRLLDIGCSTGNLLHHLRQALPQVELTGGDLMAPVIEKCRRSPHLAGISFEIMDIFDLPAGWDALVCNAVTGMLDDDQYGRAVGQFAKALKPGGIFVGYEWVFPGSMSRHYVEASDWHPDGLPMWFRAEDDVRATMERKGFVEIDIQQFDIPVDLPEPKQDGTTEGLRTYTRMDLETGRRLMYRGSIYQPWAHILALKA